VAGCKKAVAVGLEASFTASLVEGCRAAGTVGEGLAVRCYRRVATMEVAGKIVRVDAEGQDGLA
jgi:hypothetical protein